MSSAREHHAKAEELLKQLPADHDSIRRSLILAEAQVHATLALRDPGEMGPASPEQDQAADIKSTGAAHSGMRKAGNVRPAAPAGFSDRASPESRPGQSPRSTWVPDSPVTRPVAQPPFDVPLKLSPEPATYNPWQQQPRPARRPPKPGDPDEEEPYDPGEEEPGGPEKPKPGGGFRPF